MPLGSRLTTEEQAKLDLMKQLHFSIKKMSKTIGRSRDCIRRYLKDPIRYNAPKGSGRPKALSERAERAVVREASNSTIKLEELKVKLNLNVSKMTIQRVLKKSPHIERQKMISAPRLTNDKKRERMDFARNNMQTDWKLVSFCFLSS